MEIINKILKKIVPNKTFVDIGPCWETIHEKLSVAHDFGATQLTAIDQFEPGHELWGLLYERLYGIDCNYKSLNIMDYNEEPFDITYCSGVIYHAPDPVNLLKKLKKITKEYLLITSTIIPNTIKSQSGEINLPDGGLLFLPALDQKNRNIVSDWWTERLNGRVADGLLNNLGTDDADNYYGWWWLFTASALKKMCECCGFIIEEFHFCEDKNCIILLKCKN